VWLSPAITLSPVSTSPGITENLWLGLITAVVGTGNKFIAGVVDTGEQLIASVFDTSYKHSFANISANFLKKLKQPKVNIHIPGGN
jgi:hypothetical protein